MLLGQGKLIAPNGAKTARNAQYLCTGRLREYSNMLLSIAGCLSLGFEVSESLNPVDSKGFAIFFRC
jgi:hypothetical protein